MAEKGRTFEVDRGGWALRGETEGEGVPLVCCHGLTATRRYVLQGSSYLARRGVEVITYDARGHGESDPAPEGEGYSYDYLVEDLQAVLDSVIPDGRLPLLAGHSMGAHTIAAFAAGNPDAIAGMVLIGPVWAGGVASARELEWWDGLARALAESGPQGFADAAAEGQEGDDYELVHRLARDRTELHRNREAVVKALREVPRSTPLESMTELAGVTVPTLVVASHDDLDPRHPYSSAVAYAETVPGAKLISEQEGESPLAWQGGLLSREIASFAEDAGLLPG